ncbi:hypothetical protein [uncultured Jannaschia sp.]|uniref:hypothetical protein n=1 Tax=uncultured Jannaschia sp. TaxID=293347 RepID=UPI002615EB99|nr:hypothetical protein [uncultured Jannaschia sp.]
MTPETRDSVRRVLSAWTLRLAIVFLLAVILTKWQGPTPWLSVALLFYAVVSLLSSIMIERARRRQIARRDTPPES